MIALVFMACNQFSTGTAPRLSTEWVDTVKTNSYAGVIKPEIFETAFFHDTPVTGHDTLPGFFAVNIGKINIESGKIIACDPVVMSDAKPYTQEFPRGQFPVHLAIAQFNSDQRVAFSRILFSDKPVVKWEFALPEGEKQLPLFGDSSYSYGVDAGIGLFIDAKANAAFDSLRNKDGRLWEKVFIHQMEKRTHITWQYMLYGFGDYNLAAFTTGVGDGSYSTYVGYDDKGQVCRLLTDFGLVNWWKPGTPGATH